MNPLEVSHPSSLTYHWFVGAWRCCRRNKHKWWSQRDNIWIKFWTGICCTCSRHIVCSEFPNSNYAHKLWTFRRSGVKIYCTANSHTKMTCRLGAGVGSGHKWRVTVGGRIPLFLKVHNAICRSSHQRNRRERHNEYSWVQSV